MVPSGRRCRAERPAINPGRRDRHEQTPVETVVSRFDGAVAGVVVHVHGAMIPQAAIFVWRFPDLNNLVADATLVRGASYSAATADRAGPVRWKPA
jgi:hypothetical protein